MTLAHAPEGVAPAEDEASPDSSSLRVSKNTAFESGIPPARDRLAKSVDTERALEQLELVLVESTRAEANLGLLLRGLKHLAGGANAAQEANALLLQELEQLRFRVGKVYANESVLQQRVHTLENALETAAHERESWLAQEDAFLAELIDDYEQKLASVTLAQDRRMAELDRALDELRKQRDLARTEVTRLIYERDAAVALLNEPVASTERTPSPTPSRPTLGSVKLPKPALKSKPDISSRPLVGYSVVHDEPATERPETGPRGPRSR
jgi:hypothetical protein